MTRCVFCKKYIWFWQHRGWLTDYGAWHPRCWRERGYPVWLTVTDIQRILDEAQQ